MQIPLDLVFIFYNNLIDSNKKYLFKFYNNLHILNVSYLYFIERGDNMTDDIISKNMQIEIMKFFLNTSIPRILESNIKSI
jgi:hypothetical protein